MGLCRIVLNRQESIKGMTPEWRRYEALSNTNTLVAKGLYEVYCVLFDVLVVGLSHSILVVIAPLFNMGLFNGLLNGWLDCAYYCITATLLVVSQLVVKDVQLPVSY